MKQAARKGQAENFMRPVLEDDDRVDEIADIRPTEYAESRHNSSKTPEGVGT